MREPEFRALYIEDGISQGFVYGSLILIGKNGASIEKWTEGDHELWSVKRETVGEYIGLEDKNGVEIFEGDIVCVNESHKALKADFGGHIRLVQWRPGGACFDMLHSSYLDSERKIGLMFDNGMVDSIEVIGNIHENSELLK